MMIPVANKKHLPDTKKTPEKRLPNAGFVRTTVYIESELKIWAQKAGAPKRMTLSDVVNYGLRCLQKHPKIEFDLSE